MQLISFFLLGLLFAFCVVPSAGRTQRIRKNVKALTATEKADYIAGVLLLKDTASPWHEGYSYYDSLVQLHSDVTQREQTETEQNLAHGTPVFLSLHRKFLLLFEDKLNEVLGRDDVGIPYWDWTDQQSTDATFSADFMGSQGDPADCYRVVDGPFAGNENFPINILSYNQAEWAPWDYLVRGLGDVSGTPLQVLYPTRQDIEAVIANPVFDCEPYSDLSPLECSFRNMLEGYDPQDHDNQRMHNAAHWWAGGKFTCDGTFFQGQGSTLDVSPNDPMFFSLHSFVDYLWGYWQQKKRHLGVWYPVKDGPEGLNLDDPLYPYSEYEDSAEMLQHGITSRSMLFLENLPYTYDWETEF
jgi:tyrosinase